MKKLFDYSNFWLIWIECSGSMNGVSLFKIQDSWNIKTNYLYHKEHSLEKPLFKSMIESEYIYETKKGLVSKFEWIPKYILEKHKLKGSNHWSLNSFIVGKLPEIQKFIETNHEILFEKSAINCLYMNDLNTIKKEGSTIFDDIILFVFVYNLVPFCKRYGADVVIRMIYTIFSISSKKDFLGYYTIISKKIKKDQVPIIIENEGELTTVLCPLELDTTD
ncbi:MAG: hypothetical protein KAS12_06785 [Candidatus Aenigmarchaeota archaeon]|nr:hypothetical protein [Candidatus Aenigmarchaeota archaeon]